MPSALSVACVADSLSRRYSSSAEAARICTKDSFLYFTLFDFCTKFSLAERTTLQNSGGSVQCQAVGTCTSVNQSVSWLIGPVVGQSVDRSVVLSVGRCSAGKASDKQSVSHLIRQSDRQSVRQVTQVIV